MATSIKLYPTTLLAITILLSGLITSCSQKTLVPDKRHLDSQTFLSETYNHFEGGTFFADIELGMNVLWDASFKNGRPYKENLGFVVPGGLFILPNKNNTDRASRFEVTLTKDHNTLWAELNGITMQVLAIVHTHPNAVAVSEPTPKKDFQFAYLGIHNYIISHHHLYDAYYNSYGSEIFERHSLSKLTSIIINPHFPLLIGLDQVKK